MPDHKKSEKDLYIEDKCELYLARYQAISAGIAAQTTDGTITYVNNAACEILGLSYEEIVGRNSNDPIWRTIKEDGTPMPGDEHPSMVAVRTRIPQRNIIVGIYTDKHGAKRWLMVSAEPIFDPVTEEIREVLVTFIDVTDIMCNKEAPWEAGSNYRDLIEKSLAGVYVIQNGKFVYVNPRFAETHQYSQDELIGTNVLNLVAPEDREMVAENIRQRIMREVESTHYAIRTLRKDGTSIDIEVYSSYTTFMRLPAVIGIALDITERKRDEEAIRLNETQFQALLKLSQMTDSTLQEIMDFAMQEAVSLTKSKVGYLALINEEETVMNLFAWSRAAREQCNVPDKPEIYPIESTGLWGEAIRQRKPIITNDYSAPNPYKRGMPAGHIEIKNHMNVPIFDGEHIVAVAGVGNKDGDYDDFDVRRLRLLMDGMWKLIQRNRDELERRQVEENIRLFERQTENQKRQFYRETIMSVTEGKLDICDAPEIRPYLSSAKIKTDVRDASQVGTARRQIENFCAEHGLSGDRLNAFTIAVGEAITNAVKHASRGRAYAGIKNETVWVGVTDRGSGIESLILPRATLLRGFSTKPSMGLGYSIMLEVADHILLKTGTRGTTVILFKNIKESEIAISTNQLPDTWSNT